MNDLDKKILEIFKYLLNSGTEYLYRVDYISNNLRYKIDDEEIILAAHNRYFDAEIKSNSYTTVTKFAEMPSIGLGGFGLQVIKDPEIVYSITIKGKYYRVPKLGRVDQAQALDRLDSILEEYESKQVDSVLGMLADKAREEL